MGTIHFVLSCGLESKDMNPLTAIVILLHEREVGELCVSKGVGLTSHGPQSPVLSQPFKVMWINQGNGSAHGKI